jgi:sugar O-acyltransferase (sialic acid O-acetyltransferase NeuD family)
VIAVFDDTSDLQAPFPDIPLFHGKKFDEWIESRDPGKLGFCVAIGNPHGRARLSLSERLKQKGLRCVPVIHETAFISENAQIGEGCQILAGAIVGAEAIIGRQCIVNTKASVDHECTIGDAVEVGPGATLCGLVHVELNGWICAGATVLPRCTIGEDAVVGAGSVVIEDVPARTSVVGVPAKRRLEP